MIPLFKKSRRGRAWWSTPLIPALRRQRQADFWVRGQPGNKVNSRTSRAIQWNPVSKNKNKNKQTNKKSRRGIPLPFYPVFAAGVDSLLVCSFEDTISLSILDDTQYSKQLVRNPLPFSQSQSYCWESVELRTHHHQNCSPPEYHSPSVPSKVSIWFLLLEKTPTWTDSVKTPDPDPS